MLGAIERLPEGSGWVRSNQVAITDHWVLGQPWRQEPTSIVGEAALTNILHSLRGMGMSKTNLSRMADP